MKNLVYLFKMTGVITLLFLVACVTQGPKIADAPAKAETPPTPQPEMVELTPKPTTMLPIDERVVMGELPNGLKYYIQKNAKPENRAELRLAVAAGSMQEDEDQLGLAHFVEHMAFNGSANFEKNELVDYLESVGTKFGPDLNAYTSFDETVYMLQIRTDDEEQMLKGFLVLEDWAGAVAFDDEEIDKERGVVESEWRTRLSPDQRMQQKYFPIMYKDSRYAKRLPIGEPDIINNASYETVKRFYKDWYRPDLMAVVAVGDFDVKQIEAEIKTRFSKLTNPATPRARDKYPVPDHQETLVSICSDKEASFTNIRMMYKHDNEQVKTPQDFRKQLSYNLYNSMLNARLDELAQSPDPPFTFSYTGYGGDVGDLATYYSYAFTPEGGAQRGLDAIATENERVLQHGFTQTEFDRAKLKSLKNVERAVKEMDKTESRRLVSKYVYNFLDDNPIPSPTQRLDLYEKYIPTISLEEVNGLAKNWITDENRVIVVTGPEKEGSPLPTEAEVLGILDNISAKAIEPYVDKVSDEPLLAKELSPIAIESEQKLASIDATELRLANGIRVVLKPTDFKNDEIMMRSFSPGGTSLYSDKDYPSASNAASIINESGVGSFDLPQLQKKLAGKKVSVYPSIGSMYEYMNGSCSPEDLQTLFELTYLYFTAPRKDANVLQSYVTKQKSIYKNLFANPQYYFMNQTSKIKYNDHPRMGWPTAEELDKIEMDKVMEVYQDRFADASDFTFFFVGNFEVEAMKSYLTTYLGNLPTTDRKENWKDLNIDMVPGSITKALTKGEAPKALIDITYHGDYTGETIDDRMKFQMMIDLLKIKMRESMREDKGGVYGVRVGGYISKFPEPKYSINISFNSEPEKAEDLIKTAMQDLEKVRTEGAEEKDLDKVRETMTQSRIKSLKENRWWMNKLNGTYQDDKQDFKYYQLEPFKEAIGGIQPMDMKTAVQQYFNDKNRIEIVMKPAPAESN